MDQALSPAWREEVLAKIRPSEAEKEKSAKVAKRVINEINKLGYEAVLVGSRGRGTFVSNDRDIDIFVFFAPNVPREQLEKEGLAIGKKVVKKPTTHYAEHPYTKGTVEGMTVEVVPCYKIKKGDKIISAVDRSPLHNEWFLPRVKGKEDDIILLKKFLKSIDCYGAEERVHGFSGPLCETLVLNYGSFMKALEAAAGWGQKTVADVMRHGKTYERFKEPLIVIDPVDCNRNMAAAVSRSSLSKFILAAREFLARPNAEFFNKKHREVNIKGELKQRKIIVITFAAPKVIPEILWSQLDSLRTMLRNNLAQQDFQVMRSMHWTDEEKRCAIILEFSSLELSPFRKHIGPEVWDKDNCDKFKEKNNEFWIERSNLCAWKQRPFTKAQDAVKGMLQLTPQIPTHLQEPIKKASVLGGSKAQKAKQALQEYFSKIIITEGTLPHEKKHIMSGIKSEIKRKFEHTKSP